MARIKVKGYNDPYSGDEIENEIVFSFVSSPAEGRKQISLMQECRGYMCEIAAAAARGKRCSFPMTLRDAFVDMDKLRLLVSTNSDSTEVFKKRLFNAKRFINVLEKYVGWKPSKISTVDNDVYDQTMWLITGPKEWLLAPGLLSGFLLILRGMTSPNARLINFKGPRDVNKMFEALADSLPKRSYARIEGTDGTDFKYVANNFKTILKNYKSVFKGTSARERYAGGIHGEHDNGVVALCKGETGCSKVNDRVKSL